MSNGPEDACERSASLAFFWETRFGLVGESMRWGLVIVEAVGAHTLVLGGYVKAAG